MSFKIITIEHLNDIVKISLLSSAGDIKNSVAEDFHQ